MIYQYGITIKGRYYFCFIYLVLPFFLLRDKLLYAEDNCGTAKAAILSAV